MPLQLRSPETPSLETWLGRDVPHEHELARETLDRLGREKSVEVLVALHDREETKRQKRERVIDAVAPKLIVLLVILVGLNWYKQITSVLLWPLEFALLLFSFIGLMSLTWANGFPSQLQKNVVRALFQYADNPLSADPICRALYHFGFDYREIHSPIQDVLLTLPNGKEALSAKAREQLRATLWISTEHCDRERSAQIFAAMSAEEKIQSMARNALYVDFQIDVLNHLMRVRDAEVIPKLRQVVEAEPLNDEQKRLQTAARAALQAFGETR